MLCRQTQEESENNEQSDAAAGAPYDHFLLGEKGEDAYLFTLEFRWNYHDAQSLRLGPCREDGPAIALGTGR